MSNIPEVVTVAFQRIKVDPEKMRGLPIIRDTRVTVAAILGQLAARRTVEQVLEDYPYLEAEDVYEALAFAAAAMQERELPAVEPV
ncbi:MAG TPA: DUF433 domain-containing protein [Acidimicrobiales bacterium]|nr:DUF433 domain-containing protein [Acidimicrobiales bacterium]